MKKIFLFALFLSCSFFSFDATPRCYKELERSFFEERIVKEAFSLNRNRFYQSQWQPVFLALKQKAQKIPILLKNKAKNLRPNPFQYPLKADTVKKLFIETCFEVFSETLYDNDYFEQNAIQAMFDYILEKQLQKLDTCLKPNYRKKG